MHDAQCKSTPAEGCRVFSCKLNHVETAATDWQAIKAAYRNPGEAIRSEESGDYFEAPMGTDPVHAREVLGIMERRADAKAEGLEADGVPEVEVATLTTTTRYAVTITRNDYPTAASPREWLLHLGGCSKLDPTNAEDFTYAAANIPEALAQWIDAELVEMGWSTDDVRVMPCLEGSA
jgi:hypothetical protein